MLHASPETKTLLSLVDKRLLSTVINPFLSLLRLLFDNQVSISAPDESKLKSHSNITSFFKVKCVSDIEITSPRSSLMPISVSYTHLTLPKIYSV